MSYTASMFASIKDSLNKPQQAGFKDILKFEAGKSYIVRLLPNIKEPKNTFFHYYHFGWKSFATGQFVSFVSPQTIGDRCPIAEESYKIYKTGTPEEKERGKNLYRKENYLVNVYVVSDPTNPENEGKVKIMRYGSQIHKIILSAVEGDDAEEFGSKIFDLSEKGCNFRIKCEKKSEKKDEFVEYTASRFLSPSKIENLDPAKFEEIYNSLHDLTAVYSIESYDTLKKALQEHYYCVTVSDSKKKDNKTESRKLSTDEEPSDDDIPMEYKTDSKPATTSKPKTDDTKTANTPKPAAVDDEQIKSLLQGLEGL